MQNNQNVLCPALRIAANCTGKLGDSHAAGIDFFTRLLKCTHPVNMLVSPLPLGFGVLRLWCCITNRVVSAHSTLSVVTCCKPASSFTCEITATSSGRGLNRLPRVASKAQKPLAVLCHPINSPQLSNGRWGLF